MWKFKLKTILCFLACANPGGALGKNPHLEETVIQRLRIKLQRSLILEQFPKDLLPTNALNVDETEDQAIIGDLRNHEAHGEPNEDQKELIFLDTRKKIREKRNHKCGQGGGDCCLESLYIRFDQIGLDFIIEPIGYYANYCRGSCKRIADRLLAHNFLLTEYVMRNEPIARRLGISSCCRPTTYKDLNVVVFKKNKGLVNQTLSNVIAEGCGCK